MQLPVEMTLRPATPDDHAFQLAVYASTRADEMALVEWSPEQKQAFVQMQFNAQSTHYAAFYPSAEISIIQFEGQSIGRLIIDRSGPDLRLVDITLLAEQRGRGYGTILLHSLIDEAAQTNRAIIIHLEFFNPAQHLYQRLGFRKVADQGVYWEYKWEPQLRDAGTL